MVELEIWSDVACPWCYIGRANLQAALAQYEHAADVRVTWRSFELDPAAPADRGVGVVEHLASKYGRTREEAEQMVARTAEAAAAAGVEYDADAQRPGNTLLAHELVKLAAQEGLADAMLARLFRAYFAEGVQMSDEARLRELGSQVGLGEELLAQLGSGELERVVREEEQLAASLGITAVPCFVIDRQYGLSGAQPPEALIGAFEQVRSGGGAP